MSGRLLTIGAVLLYPAAIIAFYAAANGVPYALWAAVVLALVSGGVAVRGMIHLPIRPKPAGYVGKFRRGDGVIVHIARLESGRLWAASDTQPPEEIGYVDGREMMRWEKLAGEPG